ncbi:hypothetical protein LZ30DRAFT_399808 [Colletotrichum cereale]|nr:hypothetical protein LZ30DRAFT_399808 [Colletotrichum cereale]
MGRDRLVGYVNHSAPCYDPMLCTGLCLSENGRGLFLIFTCASRQGMVQSEVRTRFFWLIPKLTWSTHFRYKCLPPPLRVNGGVSSHYPAPVISTKTTTSHATSPPQDLQQNPHTNPKTLPP